MKKVIFLDFDGVLQIGKHDNPWKGRVVDKEGYTESDEYGLYFDKDCVKRLQQLIEATGADVVISSAWRYDGEERMIELWEDRSMPGKLLGIIPIQGQERIEGFEAFTRGDCILQWFMKYSIHRYVILDDIDDFLPNQKEYFIQTVYDQGLDERVFEKAISILNK